MRALGLAAILLGVLVLLFPHVRQFLPFLSFSFRGTDSLLTGGLLIAVGALTLAIHRE